MMSRGSLLLLREGTIKGEHNQTSGLSSGSSDTKHSGLLTSHRPSTSAISVPPTEQSIIRMDCVIFLSICKYPDLPGELSVSMTLVVDISQVGHYLHPLQPGIERSMDHNPSAADCEGGIYC